MNPNEDFEVVEPDPSEWPEERDDAPVVTGLQDDELDEH